MPLIECPMCLRKLRLPEDLAGRAVRCVHCGGEFTGPTAEGEPYAPIRLASPDPVPPIRERRERSADGKEPCPRCGERIWSEADRCRRCGLDLRRYDDYEDDRPWERGIRRDSEPHRAPTILALGIISIVCSPMVPCCGVIGLVFGLIGLGLGIPSWVMGRRDLTKIERGEMDPRGERGTRSGMICGMVGTSLNIAGIVLLVLFYVAMFAWLSYQSSSTPPATRGTPTRKMMSNPFPVHGNMRGWSSE
jgi:hypothetical protein